MKRLTKELLRWQFVLCALFVRPAFADRLNHLFAPPQKQWIHEKSFLRDQGDGEAYMVVQPGDRAPVRPYAYELRYFRDRKDQRAGHFCKALTYNASGTLWREMDREGQDTFTQSFYPDGSFAFFQHWGTDGMLEGHSQAHLSKMQSNFSRGKGEFILWEYDGQHFKHLWIYKGREFLAKEFSESAARRPSFTAPARIP